MASRLGRSPVVGVVVAAASVALTTALIYALDGVAPVVSLGVIYLVAVLLVSSLWGARLGVATALVSAAAFNWFHISPTGRFTISEGENWVALVAFLIAAVVTSSLAQSARSRAEESEQRRQEADLAAEMARLLLRGGGRLDDALPTVSQRLAAALGLQSAQIDLAAHESDDRRVAFPLRERTRTIGTLLVPADLAEAVLARIQVRVVPQLEALLAAALERDELMGDAVETAALRRSDVLKTALLRSVSHDLRSPLTAILTAADALDSPSITAVEREDMTRAIREEALRLSRLIDNLLDLSRLEAHAAEPHREWCSIEEILQSAVAELGLPEGAFTFSVADLPQVRADAAQLDRAFANLLENSARHSGGQPVSVRARAVGERVIVRIVDRGPGIPPAQLERVFQPFYRAGTERTGHRGSGLGLAIARGFIEVNGGRVWAESLPGQATTFVVEMPLDVAGEPAEAAPAAAS